MKNLMIILFLGLLPTILNAQMTITGPDANVGIGTSTPTVKLEVEGDTRINGNKLQLGEGVGSVNLDLLANKFLYPSYGYGLRLNHDSGGTSRFTHRGAKPLWFLGQDAGSSIKFATDFTTRMVILSDGRVGIGTNTPNVGTMLHVNGPAVKPGGGDWGMASDLKLKKNIDAFKLGLKEIMKIKPVIYQYNGKAGITDVETKYVGVIAQDFEKVAPYAIGKYTHTKVTEHLDRETYSEEVGETETYLSVNASSIRYMLVNAVKEQQYMIESLQKEINSLKKEQFNDKSGREAMPAPFAKEAYLKQNTPNPCRGFTRIEYYLPEETKAASIKVFDLTGKELQSVKISSKGESSIDMNLSELSKGMYLYALIVEGNVVESKQMLVE